MTAAPDRKTQIYLDYDRKVLAYFMSRISSKEDAEDLHAAVFEKVYRNLEKFDASKASISTWIYTIAQNTLTDYFRVRKVHNELDEEIPMEDAHLELICQQETMEELAQALSKLPERERDVLILHYYRGLSLKEIAEMMDMSYSNMKLVHNKALGFMRKYLPQGEA